MIVTTQRMGNDNASEEREGGVVITRELIIYKECGRAMGMVNINFNHLCIYTHWRD